MLNATISAVLSAADGLLASRVRLLLLVIIAFAAFSVFAVPAQARTWYVKPDGTGHAPTIQAGVDSAAGGDVVLLADGVFRGPGNRNIDFNGKNITVRSNNDIPGNCIIDCEGAPNIAPRRGFYFHLGESSQSVVKGITIANGYAWNGSSPAINHQGGAVHITSSDPKFENCRFINNVVQSNGSGGAVWCGDSYSSFKRCEFSGNSGGGGGGAAFLKYQSIVRFEECVFYQNSANNGGAIFTADISRSDVTDCTFYGNSAGSHGGGIYVYASSVVRITRSIIAYSTAGEGVYCNFTSGSYDIPVRNSDIFGNAGGDWLGCIADEAGMYGNFSQDPMFCDAASGNLYLHSDSPCAPGSPFNPLSVPIGAFPTACGTVASLKDGQPLLSSAVIARPNPFNRSTTISFTLPERANTRLSIYNIEGKLVTTLINGILNDGYIQTTWDGNDSHGNPVSSGVYFYRLKAGSEVLTKKMVLLK